MEDDTWYLRRHSPTVPRSVHSSWSRQSDHPHVPRRSRVSWVDSTMTFSSETVVVPEGGGPSGGTERSGVIGKRRDWNSGITDDTTDCLKKQP